MQVSRTDGAVPGELVLWKATILECAEKMWSFPHCQGEFNVSTLAKTPPSDFTAWGMQLYFSSTFEGASRHYQYLKRLSPQICLVRMVIPNEVVERHPPYVLRFPSDDFKKTVFYSRCHVSLKGNVDQVRQQMFLVGDTSRRTTVGSSLTSDWSAISERDLIKEKNGERVTQYSFGEHFTCVVNQHCQ